MAATAGTTTIEVPIPIREQLASLRVHERQPYHEVIGLALDALTARRRGPGLDALVERHRRALRRAAKANKMARIWLVGSRARGDARPDSDVDLMFQRQPGATAWDIGGFYADASDILGIKIDVIDIDGAKGRFRQNVMKEAVPI